MIVHNHPYHVTLLATMGLLPEITHQAACMFDGALRLVDEYQGQVLDADAGEWLADAVGDADGVILVSHGAIVIGASIEEATYRAVHLRPHVPAHRRRARSPGARPARSRPSSARALRDAFRTHALDAFWNGAVRMLLRDQPDVLE